MDLPKDIQTLLGTREKTYAEQVEEEVCALFPSLSYKDRITGCIVCAVIGFLLSFGSFLRFTELLKGNPTPFAVCFTLGSLVALAGTCFLSGPASQAKKMCHKTRRIASAMYIGSIFGTMYVAFGGKDWQFQSPALLLCVVVQYVSIIWYTLSYIPFARQWASTCLKNCCCGDEMC